MTDDRHSVTDNAAAAAMPSPPRGLRWRQFVKPFLITLAFTVVVDLGTRFVASRAGEANAAVTAVKSFGQSVEYGLESVNVFAALKRAGERLTNDRYHTAVRNWNAPFNLSEACRNTTARRGLYGIEVSNLCYTPPLSLPLQRNPLEYPIVAPLPAPRIELVDAKKYPRSSIKEIPLGIPDTVRHTLACAWDGKNHCDPKFAGTPEQQRSNWFGKLLLVAAAIFSVVVTFGSSGKPRPDEPPKVFSLVFFFGVSLFYAGTACAVVLVAVKVLAYLGLWLSGAWAALAGFPVAVWVFAALKDLAADEVKGYVAKKV